MQPAHRRSCWSRRRCSVSSRNSTPAPTRFSATTCRGAAATAWSTATARSLLRRSRIRGNVRNVLGTVSHEFFHAWNVERIRPKSLEPFNFEQANMSGELWLAEGFTQYYGKLDHGQGRLHAAGTGDSQSGEFRARRRRQCRPSIPVTGRDEPDGSVQRRGAIRRPDQFLELPSSTTIRSAPRSRWHSTSSFASGRRDAWRSTTTCERCGACTESLAVRRRVWSRSPTRCRTLAIVSARRLGRSSVRRRLFSRYIEGREVPDYARLLAPAGVVVRKLNPGAAWCGATIDPSGRVAELVDWGTPAFVAGLEAGRRDPVGGGQALRMASSRENLAKPSSLR